MKRKIIITEAQLNRLETNLFENVVHTSMVKRIKNELDKDYRVIERIFHENNEYFTAPMIEVIVDGQVITPKTLCEYLTKKYNLNEEFIKQVIKDWASGDIGEDYSLSKNIELS